MITRDERVQRHFRNSVQKKLLELLEVLDHGGQKDWAYSNYKQLLKMTRDKIDAEILHQEGFAEEVAEEKHQAALALPNPTLSS